MTIREFEQRIVDVINESKLPIDIIEVVLEKFIAEIHLEVDRAYANAANQPPATKEDEADESGESTLHG